MFRLIIALVALANYIVTSFERSQHPCNKKEDNHVGPGQKGRIGETVDSHGGDAEGYRES
jgi:hypothetical protein